MPSPAGATPDRARNRQRPHRRQGHRPDRRHGRPRFDLSLNDGRIGLFWAAAALGALLAGTVLPRLQKTLPVGWITLGGLEANALFLACWACSPELITGLLALGARQTANALVSLNGIVIRQQVDPDHLQARVNATARMLAWGG
ncbi:hypothetical protein ABZ864_37955 [Streptomyces sp. NPDC047082]|uniref:hypothetical protein n=1 Tax=Streptomyces sp. NPDC047082 TaxID=3155259 RepID=UPI0033EAFBD8